jgi:hypothetical protein
MALALPPPTQPLTDKNTGTVTEPWYRILSEISRIRSELDALKRLTQGMGAMDTPFVSAVVTFVGST